MFLFIFESIGTSELILIGIIALVVFGPRKLPQFAKTIGKTMADFRRTTDEFKSTWQREVDFEEEKKMLLQDDEPKKIETVSRQNVNFSPEIREISQADFNQLSANENALLSSNEARQDDASAEKTEKAEMRKQDWL